MCCQKAKLWEANSFEYVYLFTVPHLTREIYEQCERLAYEQGRARIRPGPNHMYTYISAIFLCDSCDPEARKALKRCRRYESFRLSYWGWMDFHTALVVLPEESVATNASGHSAAQVLKRALFHKQRENCFERREVYECCFVPDHWRCRADRRIYFLRRLAGQEVGRG